MKFQHEVWRDEHPLAVVVHASCYREAGARGSLHSPPGWYCDLTKVCELASGADITDTFTPTELDEITDVAVSIARG